MKTISLKLPDDLHLKLERMAKQKRLSKSDVVRSALEQFLPVNATEGSFLSALELAGNIVGSCEGPGDLSTNPKYMEGFGK